MFKKAPNRWSIDQLQEHLKRGPQILVFRFGDERGYVPARPMGFFSLGSRISLAWAVFTGKADALFWDFGANQ